MNSAHRTPKVRKSLRRKPRCSHREPSRSSRSTPSVTTPRASDSPGIKGG